MGTKETNLHKSMTYDLSANTIRCPGCDRKDVDYIRKQKLYHHAACNRVCPVCGCFYVVTCREIYHLYLDEDYKKIEAGRAEPS